MKKGTQIALVLLTFISILQLSIIPAFAIEIKEPIEAIDLEAESVDPVENNESTAEGEDTSEEDDKGFFKIAVRFLKSCGSSIINFFSKADAFLTTFTRKITVDSSVFSHGGFGFAGSWSSAGALNTMIATLYKITMGIGFAVMLLTWGFGMTKSSIHCSIDIKDRCSIIREIFSLIIGMTAISVAPTILTVLTSLSSRLCYELSVAGWGEAAWKGSGSFWTCITLERFDISTIRFIVGLFAEIILTLNVLWVACLQVLSPLFVACFASGLSRKIAMNFTKEYIKAILVPPVMVIYLSLCMAIAGDISVGLITAIVLGFSTLGFAGKKLDKLIN